jgi:putative RecB family exonuclease
MTLYSYSRLETFENCPLKYKYKYIDNIKREEENIETFLGSCFHQVMEKLYKDLRFKIYSLDELLLYYEDVWNKNYHPKILIKENDFTPPDYKKLGKVYIENYYNRYYPFHQSKTLGIEKLVVVKLDKEGKYKLQGYIDRLSEREDGFYEIHDYKTTSSLPTQESIDKDRQLALYQIGVLDMWKDIKEIKLIWHFVAFDKEMSSTRSREELEELRENTLILIKKIESTKDFLPKENNLCSFCEYQDICPLFKHKFKILTTSKDYQSEYGYGLVNEYVKLKKKIEEHKEEIERLNEVVQKIKEALLIYAEKNELKVVFGEEYQVKILEKLSLNLPQKNTQERKLLVETLKEMGRWEEISTINIPEIKNIISKNIWSKEEIEKIKRYLDIQVKKDITLSKIKYRLD